MATKRKAETTEKKDALKAVMGGAVNVDPDAFEDFGSEDAQEAADKEFSVSEGNHPSEGENVPETPSRASDGEPDIKGIRARVVRECFVRNHDGTCLRGNCLSRCDYERFCAGEDVNALLTDAEMMEKSSLMFGKDTD